MYSGSYLHKTSSNHYHFQSLWYDSVSQKLSLASDIVSDAVQVHTGHFSSHIGHIYYKMIINCHWTSDIMSEVFFTYVGHSGENVGHVRRVRRFLGYTGMTPLWCRCKLGRFPETISDNHFALLQTFWIQRHFTIIYYLYAYFEML